MKYDIHTHHYPDSFFQMVRDTPSDYAFAVDPVGRTIITRHGARFIGITDEMTDPVKRLEDMDRVGIDVAVISVSTPNIFFADEKFQPEVARIVNDSYAELIARHPDRFRAFASIPMDAPDAALKELHRAIDELKMNGVILLSNIRGRALISPVYRPFFQEANRMKLCIFLHPMIPMNAEPYKAYNLGPLVAFPFDTTLAVAQMCFDGIFAEFPDIKWVIAHGGGAIPYLMERLDNGYRDYSETRQHIDRLPSEYLKGLYYDTVTFNPHVLRLMRDVVGAEHMLMGSDYPHLLGSIERSVSTIEQMEIPEYEKEKIFSTTALSILNNV